MDDIKYYKTRINKELEPIKVMLVNRRSRLDGRDWGHFVRHTMNSIIRHPDQYLVEELPEKKILNPIIENIFFEFLRQQNYDTKELSSPGV